MTDTNHFDSHRKTRAQFFLQRPNFILDVDLHLPTQGVIAIFGPSGSGKTTLLRCMAGLEKPEHGKMTWRRDQFADEEVWQDDAFFLPTHKRPLGYVFQEASLFEHLTVKGNLNYAKKRRGKSQPDTVAGFMSDDDIQTLLGINHLLNRKPDQLSGGERQRVAIARALMIHPQVLFMDEPLASLDDTRKDEVLPYLETLKTKLNIPIVYVTHSANEIARLADHLVVMENGEVVTSGGIEKTLADLNNPLKLGPEAGVVLTGQIQEKDPQWHLMQVGFDGGAVWLKDSGHELGDYVRIRLLAKDISVALSHHNDSSIQNIISGHLKAFSEDTDEGMVLAQVEVGQSVLLTRITARSVEQLGLKPHMKVWVQIKSAALIG